MCPFCARELFTRLCGFMTVDGNVAGMTSVSSSRAGYSPI